MKTNPNDPGELERDGSLPEETEWEKEGWDGFFDSLDEVDDENEDEEERSTAGLPKRT